MIIRVKQIDFQLNIIKKIDTNNYYNNTSLIPLNVKLSWPIII